MTQTSPAAARQLDAIPVHRKSLSQRLRENWQLYVMLLIPVVLTIVYKYWPMYGIQIAFKNYKGALGFSGSSWVGLKNFEFFFTSKDAFRVLRNTVGMSVLNLAVCTFANVSVALMLYEVSRKRLLKLYQTVLFIPYFFSWVVVGLMLTVFLNQRDGLLTAFVYQLTGQRMDFYAAPRAWIAFLPAISVWKGVGINLMKAYLPDAKTPIKHSGSVAVVGGGNVAMDAARCAMRLGAEHVYIVYRRGEAEMPARLEEQHHAKEEGIEFKTLCNPVEILGGEDGRVNGIKCVRMELGEPDASGRRRPIAIDGSEFVLDVDTVIMALGTSPNPLIRSTTPGLDTNRKGGLIVDENEMTTRTGVFAGGDAVTGAATVILAMGAGKKGAAAIDAYLKK